MRNEWLMGLLACCIACTGTACKRETVPSERTAAAATTPPAVPLTPAETMNPDDLANITASFTCDEGMRVDIVRDAVARVNLGDGRIVKIERVRNSAPVTYMDVGLTFTQSDTGGDLDDETGRSVSCKPAEKPGA